jgi:hypothetical protein
MVPDECQLSINWLWYPKGQSNADTVTETVLWTPYIYSIYGIWWTALHSTVYPKTKLDFGITYLTQTKD